MKFMRDEYIYNSNKTTDQRFREFANFILSDKEEAPDKTEDECMHSNKLTNPSMNCNKNIYTDV